MASPKPPGTRVILYADKALSVRLNVTGARVAVRVAGEIDLDCTGTLDRALKKAVRLGAGGVDIDLSGVRFCGCAGLNILIRAFRLAERRRTTITVSAAGPAVERLLTLTDTHGIFLKPGNGTRPGMPGAPPVVPRPKAVEGAPSAGG